MVDFKRHFLESLTVKFGLAVALISLSACSSVAVSQNMTGDGISHGGTANTYAVQTASFAPASPAEAVPDYMPIGHAIAAPTGFLELCSRSPIDCRHAEQFDLVRLQTLARGALVRKLNIAFGHNDNAAPTLDPQPAQINGATRYLNWPSSAPAPQAETWQTADATSQATSDYARITYDHGTLAILRSVNDLVNRTLISDTDAHIYHVDDYWNAPGLQRGARGDCEDFALQKRRSLIEAGIPAAALSIAIVKTRSDEDHAVLIVSTTQGDYVLDSLAYDIKPWRKAGYSWISRQGPGDDLEWVSLAPANTPMSRSGPMRVAYAP